MKILFIGDIVAKPGRQVVKTYLPLLKREQHIDYVIANAENSAHGRGTTPEIINELMSYGIDYFTGGDHLFWIKDFEDVIENYPVIRPLNYPDPTPGVGYALITLPNSTAVQKKKLLLINALGRMSFNSIASYLDDPFRKIEKVLDEFKNEKDLISIVDFHAEATSEKAALGFYLDGKVTAVLGTHTHVPTCDCVNLPKGTMFVTDVGMTGIIDSVLGVKKEIIINSCLTAMNQKFEWESTGRAAFRGVILDLDKNEIARCDKYFSELSS